MLTYLNYYSWQTLSLLGPDSLLDITNDILSIDYGLFAQVNFLDDFFLGTDIGVTVVSHLAQIAISTFWVLLCGAQSSQLGLN